MGGPSAQEQQLQSEQAQQVQQEIAQQNTQYQNSQALYNTLAPQLESIMSNPTGFSPQELADLNASNVNTTGAQYANVQKQLNLTNANANMAGLTSGVAAGETAGLKGEAAGTVALNAQNTQIASAQLAQQKQQTAQQELLALQSGQSGAAIGIGGVENTAQQNAFTQAYTEQQQSSQLMNGILGGLINTGIGIGGNMLTGGLMSLGQGESFGSGGLANAAG